MSGSLTAWFPERLTTQAGVSGVASSRAITASTPILLPCEDAQQQRLLAPLYAILCIRGVAKRLTRILSNADGVPPLCTCPRTVVRVSKPSLSVTS